MNVEHVTEIDLEREPRHDRRPQPHVVPVEVGSLVQDLRETRVAREKRFRDAAARADRNRCLR